MLLRDCIKKVCDQYQAASQESFAQHELANFIRKTFRDSVAQAAGDSDRLVCKGSAGQGTWARGPWVAIFDKLETTTAQRGCYPVYLFREDMQGVYLSLNQGMTEAKREYRSDAKTALRARAVNYRAVLGNQITAFPELEIDLTPSSPSNDTAFYEAGNICAKFYKSDQLPEESELVKDLTMMLHVYSMLVSGTAAPGSSTTPDDDEPENLDFEDASRFRLHKRIERNARLVKKVKAALGCTCQICGTNFEERYGPVGKNYIEAHHLRPLASLQGQRVAMNPKKDFAVLCANCHRMVHRSGCASDLEEFKKSHYRG